MHFLAFSRNFLCQTKMSVCKKIASFAQSLAGTGQWIYN